MNPAPLTIAGVTFHVVATGFTPPSRVPAEAGFAAARPRHAREVVLEAGRIDVVAGLGACPLPEGRLIVDSGALWTMHAAPGGYLLSFRRAGREVYKTAACDAGTTRAAVTFEASLHARERAGGAAVSPEDPLNYPLDQLLLMNHLAPRGGFILHGGGVALDDGGVAFAGVSGAGKSTLARSFIAAGLEAALLSDERVVLRRGTEGWTVWGTPWPGDAQVARNAGAPLRALVFLVHAARDRLVRLSPAEAARRLFPAISCPWYDRERLLPVLAACDSIVGDVPCYALEFAPGPAAAELVCGLVPGVPSA